MNIEPYTTAVTGRDLVCDICRVQIPHNFLILKITVIKGHTPIKLFFHTGCLNNFVTNWKNIIVSNPSHLTAGKYYGETIF